jgi:hypothetical protein
LERSYREREREEDGMTVVPVVGSEGHAPDARIIAALCPDKIENGVVA